MGELRKQDPASLPMTKHLFCFSGEKAPRMTSENTEKGGLCNFPCWHGVKQRRDLALRPCAPLGEALLRAAEGHHPPSSHCPGDFTLLNICAT